MRRWIAQTGLSYVTLVAGIEVGGSFDEAPDRAFRALAGFIDGASRSRRQIAVTAPVIQQNTDLEHPEKIAMTAPVVRQTAGRPGWRRARRLDRASLSAAREATCGASSSTLISRRV